jgi:hypothetical protein
LLPRRPDPARFKFIRRSSNLSRKIWNIVLLVSLSRGQTTLEENFHG